MNRYYYKLVIENKQKTLKYIDKELTDKELNLSQKLDNIILIAEHLMGMQRIMVDSFLKLKKVNFQTLKKVGDTDQINELVINLVSNAKLFIDYLDRRWAPKYISDFNEEWKSECSAFYDESESYRLCYHLRNFVQHSGTFPIEQISETSGYGQNEVNTTFILNIDAFKEFKKEFSKLNISDLYWEDKSNLSFMKHANKYVTQLTALYQLALSKYIQANRDTLDEIQANMRDTVLRNPIAWSNTSPQEISNAAKQNNFIIHPVVMLPDLYRFYKKLEEEKIINVKRS